MTVLWLSKEIDALNEYLTPPLTRFLGVIYDLAEPESDSSDQFIADKAAVLDKIAKDEGKMLSSQDARNRLRAINGAIKDKSANEGEPSGLSVKSRKMHYVIQADGAAKMRSSRAALVESSSEDAKEIDDKAAKLRAVKRPEHIIFVSHAWEDPEIESILDEFVAKLDIKLGSFKARSQGRFTARSWIDRKDVKATSAEFADCTDPACAKASIGLIMCSDKWFQSEPCQKEHQILRRKSELICVQLTGHRGTTEFRQRPMFPELWKMGYNNLLDVMSLGASEKDSFVSSVANEIYRALDNLSAPDPSDTTPEGDDGPVSEPGLLPRTPDRFDLSRQHDPAQKFERARASAGNTNDSFYIVEHLCEWATDDMASNRIYAILGGFGSGKSTSSKQFVDEINTRHEEDKTKPFAIYLDFRRLIEVMDARDTSRTELGDIFTLALRPEYRDNVDKKNLVKMIQDERCIVVFDGLDEVGTGLGEARASALYRQLLETIPARVRQADLKQDCPDWDACQTRMIVTCRTQFFRDHIQEDSVLRAHDRTAGLERKGHRSNIEKLYMVPFEETQIRSYFTANLGEPTASQTFQFIKNVHDLMGLASKPLLMKYIMDMAPDLIADRKAGRVINLARVYYHIFRRVVERDGDKRPILEPDDRADILKALAFHLWVEDLTQIRAKDLQAWFDSYVSDHDGLKILYAGKSETRSLMLLELRNANLLRRDNDEFRFTHTSFYEYFLALSLFDLILSGEFEVITKMNFVSAETMEFLYAIAESEGREADLLAQCRALLCSEANMAARQLLLSMPNIAIPPKANLSGLTITPKMWNKLVADSKVFQDVNFQRAKLKRCQIEHVTFLGCQFAEANMVGTTFKSCKFLSCEGQPINSVQVRTGNSHLDDGTKRSVFPDIQYMFDGVTDRIAGLTTDNIVCHQGHKGLVHHGAFSPDGVRVLTVSHDRTARIWDASSGAELACLTGHEAVIVHGAFSPDGLRVLTVSHDRTARIWDASSGAELACLTGHEAVIVHGAFSPDGLRVLTVSRDRTARIWDASSGAELACLTGHEAVIVHGAFSPDGLRVLTVSHDRTARIWDASSGAELACLTGHEDWVSHGAFSPDGVRVLTVSHDRTARIWDASSGAELTCLTGHEDWVSHGAFSPDGLRVLTVSRDRTARIWDASSGAELLCLTGHEAVIVHGAFSPDGLRVLTVSHDQTARIWDASSGAELACLTGHEDWVSHGAFSPDGLRVLTVSRDRTARIWDASSGAELLCLTGHEAVIVHGAFSPDGVRVLTVSHDRTARIWDASSGAELTCLTGHEDWVVHGAFSPDGLRVLTVSHDRTARIWDASSGAELACLTGHEDWVSHGAFSPDGVRVLTVSHDRTARIWDASSGAELTCLTGHEDWVVHGAFSPDGLRVLTVSHDRTARIWDASSGAELTCLTGHEDWVVHGAFSPDGLRVLTVSRDRTARIWDASSGAELTCLTGHEDWVVHGAFSPDGVRVLTVSYDRTARIWDASSGAELTCLTGHEDWVVHGAFSPDGLRVLTVSYDRTARIWDASSGAELFCFKGHVGGIDSMSVSLCGRWLALFGYGAYIYDLERRILLRSSHAMGVESWQTHDHVSGKVIVGPDPWRFIHLRIDEPTGGSAVAGLSPSDLTPLSAPISV